MGLSLRDLILIIIILIIICYVCYRYKSETSEKGCDCPIVALPKCLSDANCDPRETCSGGYCTDGLCASCSFELLPTYEPMPPAFPGYLWTIRGQSDGGVIVAGFSGTQLVRFNQDGTLDVTFGVAGTLTTPETFTEFFVSSDDSIYVHQGTNPAKVRKYTPTGTLDVAFGVAGVLTIGVLIFLRTFKETSDGSIVLIFQESFTNAMSVVKFSSSGVLDVTFGTGGYVTLNPLAPPIDQYNIYEFGITPDNKIVLAGNLGVSPANTFGSIRLNSDGTLDTSYGVGGVCVIPIAQLGYNADICDDVFSNGATYLPDGTAFVHGYVANRQYSNACDDYFPYTQVRITSDGVFDTSYGENGLFVFAQAPFGYYENYHSNAILPCDGGQLIPLQSYDAINDNTYLVKVTPDGKLDTKFPLVKGEPDSDYFWQSLYHDGKIFVVGSRGGGPLLWVFSCE